MQQPGEYRLESLYGQEPPPEEMVLGGMAHLESELTRRFERRLEQQRQTSVHQQKVRRPLIEVVRQDPEAAEGVRGAKSRPLAGGESTRSSCWRHHLRRPSK